MVTAETCSCLFFFFFDKSILRKKNSVLLIEKFPSLVVPKNAIMLQHFITQFSLYYLSSDRLQEVKNKENFKLLAQKKWLRSLTRGGCLQKVPNIVISLGNFWYFGKVVAEERWSQPEVGLYVGLWLKPHCMVTHVGSILRASSSFWVI